MRNWTPEQRQRQRELIHRWKPWEKSTGAKTQEGKAKSAKNASKGDTSLEIRKIFKVLNYLLNEQKKLTK